MKGGGLPLGLLGTYKQTTLLEGENQQIRVELLQ